ncbi:MAG: 1-acyl-sn-glycerol-3-phosphate acyltransferase [Myxococcota bacterium]
MRPVVRAAFRPTLEGTERLPEDGPYLLVGNHSAGLGIAELTSFVALYAERFGGERPLAAFAHPIGFRFPPMAALHRALGSVPSTYEAAEETLAEGVPLLVFPGGDHETLRPVWQAHRVDFGGRRGFLRIARKMGVPVVPMGIRGSHFTAPILLRSRALAWVLVIPRLAGIKRWGVSLLGAAGAATIAVTPLPGWARAGLVWLWLASPVQFLPVVPWTIRFRIGEPLSPDILFDPEDEDLSEALARVEAAVQDLVDRE